MTRYPSYFFVQRSNGKRFRFAITGLSQIHQFRMIVHHHGSFRFSGMVVNLRFKIAFGRHHLKPVCGSNQKVGIFKSKVTNHPFKIIPSVSTQNQQLTKSLYMKGRYDIFQNSLLGGISGMDTERQFTLPGIMRSERYGRHHHATDTRTAKCQFGCLHSNIMGENAIGEIRQM